MQNKILFKLRIKWFAVKAKEFINRYFMGVVILTVFLPGVGVGENFNLLMLSITKPFVIISQSDATFFNKQVWLYLLMAIFVVWSRAQRVAINGGAFSQYLNSLPINHKDKVLMDVSMLLIGNHFLWPFILASYYYLPVVNEAYYLTVINNTFLILLLLTTQHLSVFNCSFKNMGIVLILAIIFTLPVNSAYEVFKLALLFVLLPFFVLYHLFNEHKGGMNPFKFNIKISSVFNDRLYFQMLFKSGLTSSLFRISIIIGLMFGFTIAVNNWVNNGDNLMPYYLVLEALIAYFVSGFYVSFLDQRNAIKPWLITLPIKQRFWVVRDVFVVLVLTFLLHGCFFIWAINISNMHILFYAFLYHVVLLLVCYPIRLYLIKKQTFITFVVLFIITAITLFNLS